MYVSGFGECGPAPVLALGTCGALRVANEASWRLAVALNAGNEPGVNASCRLFADAACSVEPQPGLTPDVWLSTGSTSKAQVFSKKKKKQKKKNKNKKNMHA